MELLDYSKLYPNMPLEICMFFEMQAGPDQKIIERTISDFCNYYNSKYSPKDYPQPGSVSKICDILCENNSLSVVRRAGVDNTSSVYLCVLREQQIKTDQGLQYHFNKSLSYSVYGFKFIYEDFKKYVLPIEYTDKDDNKYLGTCFLYRDGIATAKHCIEGAKKIAIQGIAAEDLKKAQFEIHNNPLMDLLFIRFEQKLKDTLIFHKDASVLDEVMTLGYPKIAGYHNFLTAENAVVSSRFTASIGQIASNAEDIWIKEKLFLITAKIKGGNSGGPVVSKKGAVTGVAVNLVEGRGDYDQLGYGTVIPVSFLNELINDTEKKYLNTKNIEFIIFE